MGKLRDSTSPPNRGGSSTFPRMDPPPPYEESSRSSSAHSNDRLQRDESPQPQSEAAQQAASHPETSPQQAASASASAGTESCQKRQVEDGCCTFGDGASGCMVVGDHAEGCLNYGDHAEGCLNYGDNTSGWPDRSSARNVCGDSDRTTRLTFLSSTQSELQVKRRVYALEGNRRRGVVNAADSHMVSPDERAMNEIHAAISGLFITRPVTRSLPAIFVAFWKICPELECVIPPS
ncbi:hypothetical protein AYO20_04269 [Fonsecaea nubica]|uniref:Uncharacterized protein n=1 Tax=Fonsecaea nubica TaxID=856822 RepID=A0A178D526_9EURO|nr:hypothetical protein AYO20_04269 [Fonsecaea nubica]OAL36373.1 hypothetical protein AYO20_04269 [Fonsecaea nubica]